MAKGPRSLDGEEGAMVDGDCVRQEGAGEVGRLRLRRCCVLCFFTRMGGREEMGSERDCWS